MSDQPPTDSAVFTLPAKLLHRAGLNYRALMYSNKQLSDEVERLRRRVAQLEAERDQLQEARLENNILHSMANDLDAMVAQLKQQLAQSDEINQTLVGRNYHLEARLAVVRQGIEAME